MANWTLRHSPRTWQIDAVSLWKNSLKGIVKVVTGGGKTVFAEMCILEFKSRFPDGKVFIVVPTIALLDQWHVSLQEDLGVGAKEISVFSGQEHSKKISEINLIVVNTARKLISSLSKNYSSFLIVDECHRVGSFENSKSLRGDHQASLGISATPHRDYDDGFKNFLQPKLGNIIYEYDYVDAQKDGVITDFELINIRFDFLSDEMERYEKLTRQVAGRVSHIKEKGDPSGREYEKLKRLLQLRSSVVNSASMRIPVASSIAEMEKGNKTIIFHERVNAADKIYFILRNRGHNVTVYHSKIDPVIRRDNLRLFRKGAFDILITCKALDEGLNVPESSVAIIASATASTRQRIQRLGRVLRPVPGKQLAKIYTLYVSNQEKDRLIKEASSYQNVVSVSWKEISRVK